MYGMCMAVFYGKWLGFLYGKYYDFSVYFSRKELEIHFLK